MFVGCVVLLLLAACSDSDSTPTTTAVPVTTTTTTVPATTAPSGSVVVTTSVTTTTAPVFSIPEFVIADRTVDDEVVVAIPPGTYSDIDLQNVVNEVIERFAPITVLHIVDDEGATALVLADSVSAADQEFLDEHYFLRLEEGFRMVFLGPFADVGEVILGS